MTSLISPIVQVCDAISGARPGARREVMESYIKRLKEEIIERAEYVLAANAPKAVLSMVSVICLLRRGQANLDSERD